MRVDVNSENNSSLRLTWVRKTSIGNDHGLICRQIKSHLQVVAFSSFANIIFMIFYLRRKEDEEMEGKSSHKLLHISPKKTKKKTLPH
jgi:hypothetical protein